MVKTLIMRRMRRRKMQLINKYYYLIIMKYTYTYETIVTIKLNFYFKKMNLKK